MFLLIDNYDSFTYNLVQAFYRLGKEVKVVKNDDPALPAMAKDPLLKMVCISPGPGRPENAGFCLEFLKNLDPGVPVLGVCLGHQVLGLFGGGEVVVGPQIMHGKQSDITHDGKGLFSGLPNPMKVGRYHSLVVREKDNCEFKITARGPEGECMALVYNDRPWVGVQFHPESVLTDDGLQMLNNFPEAVRKQTEGDFTFATILERLATKQDLSAEMASWAFTRLMDGVMTQAQAGAFLTSLRMKGECALELAHAVRAALARAVRVGGIEGTAIDIVGTGGDGRHSFNCSTASSFVVAGLGYRVIKHGNRAVSSTCGAADAMESLGIPLEKDPVAVVEMLKQRNLTFLFAPYFHPAFKNIGPLRKELGVRTLFNILGPMINPARTSHLLMGVARESLMQLVADTLLLSPTLKRAAVVCGAGDYDEVTPIGPARILLLDNGTISTLPLDPAKYDIKPCTPDDLAVHSREDAVRVLREILEGKGPEPMRDMVVLNVALALYLLEEGQDMDACMARAREAVTAGVGRKVLNAA